MKCKASVRGSCQAPHPGVELAKAVAHPHEVVEPPRDGEVGVSCDELHPARADVIPQRAAATDAQGEGIQGTSVSFRRESSFMHTRRTLALCVVHLIHKIASSLSSLVARRLFFISLFVKIQGIFPFTTRAGKLNLKDDAAPRLHAAGRDLRCSARA